MMAAYGVGAPMSMAGWAWATCQPAGHGNTLLPKRYYLQDGQPSRLPQDNLTHVPYSMIIPWFVLVISVITRIQLLFMQIKVLEV